MDTTNRITAEDLSKVAEDICMPINEADWNGLRLIVRRNISLEEMLEFVANVTGLCFESDTNKYIPEVKDFGIRTSIINYYTNVDLPESTSEKYSLLYSTDIIQTVIKMVDPQQFNSIVESIENAIDHIANANIEMFNKQVQKITELIEQFGELFEDSFSGISKDEMIKLVENITNFGDNEEKFVQAYLSQTKENYNSGEKVRSNELELNISSGKNGDEVE